MKNLQTFLVAAFMLLGLTSSAQIVLLVEEPLNLAGSYDLTYSSANGWGANMDTTAITAPAVFAVDGTNADSLACDNIINGSEVTGKIAVVYRGDCQFSTKAKNVQDAGAVAVVIINNIPGGPVGMGAGTVAGDVTIPVAMISQTDGALLLDSIEAGSVVMYLGNNTGVYPYNVGTYPEHISRAKSFATPKPLVEPDGDGVRPSGWVYNYGSEVATGVKVSAVISRDGNEVYNDTTAAASIPANGDSMYFTLPEFVALDAGLYTLTYSILSDSTDAYPSDNQLESSFWINENGLYSKTRIDPVEGPIATSFVQPASTPFAQWQWCNSLQVTNANDMVLTGVQFAATASDGDTTVSLEDKSVYIYVYQLDNYDPEGTSLNLTPLIESDIYDFTSDTQEEFVTHPLSEAIPLSDNTRYWTCLLIDDPELYIGYDSEVEYAYNFDSVFVREPVSPVYVDDDQPGWAIYGFTNGIGSIISVLEDPNGIAEDVEDLQVVPYPNPTTDYITIPLGGSSTGNVGVTAFDMKGALVLSENASQQSGNLRVDVSQLASGLHIFNLTFEDNSTTTFRVMISR